ncbi:MAG: tRNA uridine-5-carboxymethylaminomethyl(34) synthesis GTPase MnmE [Candidatus Cloacimonetes bacterium 4572_55]|nr:MAG: tRNA uridine-5-carboxymethylaminomethyl(34) synthesis GTPase MnmE [Candidatus Cloacimonetes bacterium 4572_55]
MKFEIEFDAIAAISTSPGVGAISIVRLSGADALKIADRIFKARIKPSSMKSHTIRFGSVISDQETIVDQVLLTVMRAPSTFTGEDTVEINCHGGQVAARLILKNLIHNGARAAEPGEFTKRAFLNGKLDLTQAEAIDDLIHARTDSAGLLAVKQLAGHLSKYVHNLRQGLLEIASRIELAIDFSEEELDPYNPEQIISLLTETKRAIQLIIGNIERGRIIKEGASVVICGKENVGKSSIFNALLTKKRAIVSSIPGTTRDVIEDSVNISGVPLRLFDAAGIRQNTDNEIEDEGISRSRRAVQEADLVLFVLDQSQNIDREERELYQYVKGYPHMVVCNKIDLISSGAHVLPIEPDVVFVSVSALTGQGIDDLTQAIAQWIARNDPHFFDRAIAGNFRQETCLQQALESIRLSICSLREGNPPELAAVDVQAAIRSLGEVIGVVSHEDVLNSIFEKFCIGK